MYHYTYLIQHRTQSKRYIGVRSCHCLPLDDVSYWGSSKHIPKDVQTTHVKIILKQHDTRKEAIAHEILLHELNNVVVNSDYYNKAKQTSTGFDTSGSSVPDYLKAQISTTLKGRIFSVTHRQNLSKSTLGKKKSDEHKKNCSKAQKLLASSKDYHNPRAGVELTEETKKKISDSLKALGCNASTNANRFKPWFITIGNVTTLYYDITKEEASILHGCSSVKTYQQLSTRSKGYLPIKRGPFKDAVIGNIEDAIINSAKIPKPLQKRAWFITYETYSTPFYYTTRKEYAEQCNIPPQTISDAIHLSKGVKPLKKGYFKGCILGRIT